MKRDLVLEIGVENMPASYVRPAVVQLKGALCSALEESRLPFDSAYSAGTPRRLVVVVSALSDRQEAAEELVTGPPVSKAFGEDGAPTRAAAGFARSQGLDVADLERIDTPRGKYLGFRRRLERSTAKALLGERLPGLIASLRFPKTMKWEPSGARFARPVRWIVCLYGGTVVPFRFADVESGRRTHRRPWMRAEGASVRSAATYRSTMARLGVIVDDNERRDRVRRLAERAAQRLGLAVVDDPDLLEEITYMAEDPRVLVGEFPEEYLRLPSEVVTTAMRAHQRYFALVDGGGKLVRRFITFTDGKVLAPAEVKGGNEKVLKARLADARFYWNEDVKRGVDSLTGELDRIVFIEGLGTIGEKRRRIERVALWINERVTKTKKVDEARVRRACELAKSDLASEMIKDGKEFTKLQGLIGSYYAREAGEGPDVVAAVREHYQPRTPADAVPESALAALVGIADRIDTVCGCFLAGFTPSGSQDPYGLRRLANGLIRIVRAEPGIRLDELIRCSLELYAESGYGDRDRSEAALVDFFKVRCEAFLKDNGVPYDIADAVDPVSWTQPGVALDRAREITRLRGDQVFERLITGVKRVGNILSPEMRHFGVGWDRLERAIHGDGQLNETIGFSPERFEDAEEHGLLAALRSASPLISEAEARGAFSDVLHALSGLADPIDAYFDRVLVNCEDAATRENRHAFLAVAYSLFSRFADFSAIVEAPESAAS